MKRKKWHLLLLIASIALLCGCSIRAKDPPLSPSIGSRDELVDAVGNRKQTPIHTISVSHGDDTAIQWEDPGMEAHIRLLLDKPEGDIFRSDVWDIQALLIGASDYDNGKSKVAARSDLSLEKGEAFYPQWKYSESSLPSPQSLADLQYFESLQVLDLSISVKYHGNETAKLDLSGLEKCKTLRSLSLENIDFDTIAPVAKLTGLRTLGLDKCHSLDISFTKELPDLESLALTGCEISSLEPLTSLQKLTYLNIGEEATYPSLEPLTRTNIQYLNMGLSVNGRSMYQNFDFTPLADMTQLVFLDMSNHQQFRTQLCNDILDNNPDLRYLDISYTPAADHPSELHTNNLKVLLDTQISIVGNGLFRLW